MSESSRAQDSGLALYSEFIEEEKEQHSCEFLDLSTFCFLGVDPI